MTTDKLKVLLEQIIQEEVEEIIRRTGLKFNMNEFRALKTAHDAYWYAYERLKFLGSGSSRAVFLLSSGKVLKIAHDMVNAGKSQNMIEVETFTAPTTKPVIAKIYDFQENFNWIISELVSELTNATIRKKFDMSVYELLEIIEDFIKGKTEEDILFTIEAKCRKQHCETNYKKQKDKYQKAFVVAKPLAMGLRHLKSGGMDLDDILGRQEHFGFTSDGRIVVLDYGWDDTAILDFYHKGGESWKEIPGPPKGLR